MTRHTPWHLYVMDGPGGTVMDFAPDGADAVLIPGCTGAGEPVVGLACDKNMDIVALRCGRGNTLRFIKRSNGLLLGTAVAEGVEPGLPQVRLAGGGVAAGGGLAVIFQPRHYLLDQPDGRSIIRVDRAGRFKARIDLKNPCGVIGGLSYDSKRGRIAVLFAETGEVAMVDMEGREVQRMRPSVPVTPLALGYDPVRDEWYVPLASPGGAVGVFDAGGALVRTIAAGVASPVTALDVAPRQYVRVF